MYPPDSIYWEQVFVDYQRNGLWAASQDFDERGLKTPLVELSSSPRRMLQNLKNNCPNAKIVASNAFALVVDHDGWCFGDWKKPEEMMEYFKEHFVEMEDVL